MEIVVVLTAVSIGLAVAEGLAARRRRRDSKPIIIPMQEQRESTTSTRH